MPVPAAIASWAAANPQLAGMLLQGGIYLGGRAVSSLIGSPEEEQFKQSLAAMSRLQPQYLDLLQKQMAGQPTAASEAIRGQVAQTSRAGQQALATSARRTGQGGTEVARANQARFLAAMAQMEGQQLGRAQLEAQKQVGGLTSESTKYQALLAAQESQEIQEIVQAIMKGAFDKETQDLLQEIANVWNKQTPAYTGAPAPEEAPGFNPFTQTFTEGEVYGPPAPTASGAPAPHTPAAPPTVTPGSARATSAWATQRTGDDTETRRDWQNQWERQQTEYQRGRTAPKTSVRQGAAAPTLPGTPGSIPRKLTTLEPKRPAGVTYPKPPIEQQPAPARELPRTVEDVLSSLSEPDAISARLYQIYTTSDLAEYINQLDNYWIQQLIPKLQADRDNPRAQEALRLMRIPRYQGVR